MKAANDDGTPPTDEGRKRYPRTFGYYPNLSAHEDNVPDPTLPCTCNEECLPRCAGECGCAACAIHFQVFYSDRPQFISQDDEGNLVVDEEAALIAYRYGDYF